MTLKEFSEDCDIEYTTSVIINGRLIASVSSYDENGLIEQYRKLDHAIAANLQEQYEDLSEPIEDESRGYDN